LTLQFIARKDPSQFKDTKAAEALFKTLIGKLETLEKGEDRVQREILVTVASTISILALKDASVLAGGKAIEQADLGEVIAKSMEKTEGESEIRSILMSALIDLSRGRASDYINNRNLLDVLLKLLEGSEEEDANYRSALLLLNRMATAYPNLFNASATLERIASLAVKRETARERGDAKSKLAPADVFGLLWHSEKGSEILIGILPQMYEENPDLVEHLLKLDSLRYLQGFVAQKGILAESKVRPFAQTVVREAKPAKATVSEPAPAFVATESLGKGESLKPKGLTDQQKSLLQDMFRTQAEISLSDLARKLDVSESTITEALGRLISSGKLPYRIHGGVLYLKEPPQTPAEILAAAGVPVTRAIKKVSAAKCIWCGAHLNLVDDKCSTCGKKVARCFICNDIIENEKELEKCPFCSTLFHADHYKKWVEVRKYCPKCRIPIA
jgi:hypothetical protein